MDRVLVFPTPMQKMLAGAGVPLVSKLKLISWNVNSLRAREPLVQKLIELESPDILCVQELKIDDKEYVNNFFSTYDYQTVSQTQKSYNGVSISIKNQYEFKELKLSKLNDHQARNNTIILEDKNIVLLNNYFPNGNPIDSDKFDFKKQWMNDLYNEVKNIKQIGKILIAIKKSCSLLFKLILNLIFLTNNIANNKNGINIPICFAIKINGYLM